MHVNIQQRIDGREHVTLSLDSQRKHIHTSVDNKNCQTIYKDRTTPKQKSTKTKVNEMQDTPNRRVIVMSNSNDTKCQQFMEGNVSTKDEDENREHAKTTTEIELDWKLAGNVSAKAYVGVPETICPVRKHTKISAFDYTKKVVDNQVRFAKHCLNQIRDAIVEINRVLKQSRVDIASRVLSQLDDVQKSATVMLATVEASTTENFPVHRVMDFIGAVDDSVQYVISTVRNKEILQYPLAVVQNSVKQVRETIQLAQKSAHSLLINNNFEKFSSPLLTSLSNLNAKLLALREQLLEQVSKINGDKQGESPDCDNEESAKVNVKLVQKIESILNKIGRSVLLGGEARVKALKQSLRDLSASLEGLKDQTREIYSKKTRELAANARKNADDIYAMLKSNSENFLEFIKDRTKQKIVDMDGKYNLKANAAKFAAATRNRVISVDKQYNISEKLSETKRKTDSFLKSWGIDVESIMSNVIKKADHYDNTLIGGLGKNVLQKAKQTAEDVQKALDVHSVNEIEE